MHTCSMSHPMNCLKALSRKTIITLEQRLKSSKHPEFTSFTSCFDHNEPRLTLKHSAAADSQTSHCKATNSSAVQQLKCECICVFGIQYYVPDPMTIIIICPALTFKDSQYDHLLCWSVTAHSLCGQLLGLELVTTTWYIKTHESLETSEIIFALLCLWKISALAIFWFYKRFKLHFRQLPLLSPLRRQQNISREQIWFWLKISSSHFRSTQQSIFVILEVLNCI